MPPWKRRRPPRRDPRGRGRVGFKAAGGIRTAADAAGYLHLADAIMGSGWARPGPSGSAPRRCRTSSAAAAGPKGPTDGGLTAAGDHPRQRDGNELAADEIAFLVRGITDGSVGEGQAAAFAMSVFFRGMTRAETVALTRHARPGRVLAWRDLPGPVVDKHSTGASATR